MRYIQTSLTTLELEQDPVIDFPKSPNLTPGEDVYLITGNGHQVLAHVDDVDDCRIYFISRP